MPIETDKSIWDELWSRPEEGYLETWRQHPGCFGRIGWLIEHVTKETHVDTEQPATIVDLGCGVGVLLSKIRERLQRVHPDIKYYGVDFSESALEQIEQQGFESFNIDLNNPEAEWPAGDILLCTETLEHLPIETVRRILKYSTSFAKAFFMVPNWSLGPDEEPTHQQKWTAKEFLDLIREFWPNDDRGPTCRVECLGYDANVVKENNHHGYLLGVCGYDKPFTLALTMPVKNEQDDIERVLSSFRGAVDEIVIGIDDTSDDLTEEIVKRYADTVFFFTWEQDFSKARNVCIDRCESDWIFMTEGHESLYRGSQALLQLDEIPSYIHVLEVKREAKNNSWYFPWLFRNHKNLEFHNAVHNTLTGYEHSQCCKTPQISTWHERSKAAIKQRIEQRKTMNKQEYLRRIREEKNVRDMYYLGVEYMDVHCKTCHGHSTVSGDAGEKEPCPDCAVPSGVDGKTVSTGVIPYALRQSVYWLQAFIDNSKACSLSYQARLELGGLLRKLQKHSQASYVLVQATMDDPTRIEHWIALGDIREEQGDDELAMRFYEYASLGIGRPPASYMFLNKRMYTYVPAQKLCSIYYKLGRLEDALQWAKRVPELMPEWAPKEAVEEAHNNIEMISQDLERSLEQQPIAAVSSK